MERQGAHSLDGWLMNRGGRNRGSGSDSGSHTNRRPGDRRPREQEEPSGHPIIPTPGGRQADGG